MPVNPSLVGKAIESIAERGQIAPTDGLQDLLTFLAGVGFPEFVRMVERLKGGREPRGMRRDAQLSGGMAPPPAILAALMQQRQNMAQLLPGLLPPQAGLTTPTIPGS